jgi:hypothetical protein
MVLHRLKSSISFGRFAQVAVRMNKLCLFLKGKYLEEYMVVNMKMGKRKVGRIEN